MLSEPRDGFGERDEKGVRVRGRRSLFASPLVQAEYGNLPKGVAQVNITLGRAAEGEVSMCELENPPFLHNNTSVCDALQ